MADFKDNKSGNNNYKKPSGPGGFKKRMLFRKKVCKLCKEGIVWLDYKDVDLVRTFVTKRGKIISAKVTGTCALHQKQVTTAVKRLRNLALLPYTVVK